MTLSERRILKSVEYMVQTNHVQILWEDQILREGEVISATTHRGAYPTNDKGEPDDSVINVLGKTIEDILGGALAGSQKELVIINNKLAERDGLIWEYTNEITRLQSLVEVMREGSVELERQLQQMDEEFQTASGKATELQTSWEVAQEELVALRAQVAEFQLMSEDSKPA